MKIEAGLENKDGRPIAGCGTKITTMGGEDISNMISSIVINMQIDEVVRADVVLNLSTVSVDGAVMKINGIVASDEVLDALRVYFKG